MNEINLNLYKIFYDVAICGSFSETAKKLYVSQPAISKSIKTLEDTLQTKLFIRQNNGIQLTNDGKKLFVYVESAYNFILTGQKSLVESNNLTTGSLTIGAPAHIAAFYLLKHIEKFHKDFPGIEIKLISFSTAEMIKELQQNKIDFVIDTSPIDTIYNNMEIKFITSFKNCFIYNAKANINETDINIVAKLPFVLPLKRSSVVRTLESYIKEKYNIKISPVLEVETTELIISAVKRNIGIGYVIKESVKHDLEVGTLKEFKFFNELPKVDLNLIYIKDYLTSIPQKFINEYLK